MAVKGSTRAEMEGKSLGKSSPRASIECGVCAYADAHGEWPPELLAKGGTHCRGCHRSWVSHVEAHCVDCHLHFSSDTAAVLHDPYCHPDTERTLKRLLSARRSSGRPILALRERKHGSVLATPSSKTGESKRGALR